jgi:hypothetical protein
VAVMTQLFRPEELARLSAADIEILKLNAWRALTEEVPAEFAADLRAKADFRLRYGGDIDDPDVRQRVNRVLEETYRALLTRK